MYYACSDYKVRVVSLTKSVSRRHYIIICSLALPTITYFVQCMIAFLARDRHIMLFLEPIMLCSSSQFCSHYAHTTIPSMPALCSNLKDSAHVFRNLHLL